MSSIDRPIEVNRIGLGLLEMCRHNYSGMGYLCSYCIAMSMPVCVCVCACACVSVLLCACLSVHKRRTISATTRTVQSSQILCMLGLPMAMARGPFGGELSHLNLRILKITGNHVHCHSSIIYQKRCTNRK